MYVYKDGFVETIKFPNEISVIEAAYKYCNNVAKEINLGFDLCIHI